MSTISQSKYHLCSAYQSHSQNVIYERKKERTKNEKTKERQKEQKERKKEGKQEERKKMSSIIGLPPKVLQFRGDEVYKPAVDLHGVKLH